MLVFARGGVCIGFFGLRWVVWGEEGIRPPRQVSNLKHIYLHNKIYIFFISSSSTDLSK